MNMAVISGNLTRSPELREAGSTSVVDLGVAVNERVKKGDDWEDRASFIDVTVFGKQAEACANYLSKGSRVVVQGRLQQDRWETDDGKRSKVKIVANIVQFPPKGESSGEAVGGDDGDLPF